MTKLFLSLSAFLCFASVVSASNPVLDNPDNCSYWGVRIGYDWNLPGEWNTPYENDIDLFKSGSGVSVTGIYNLPIKANLFFEPGVTFYYDKYAYKDLLLTDETGMIVDKDPKVRKYGIRIPLSLGYRFDFFDHLSMSLFTGPQFGYAFYGDVKTKEDIDGFPENLFSEYGQRRFNLDWNIGFGVEFNYHWVFSITGSIGLNDLQKNDVSFKENRLVFALGYNF